ncbi:hypothetical protein ACHAWF_013326 [Thalassiosira exigua]
MVVTRRRSNASNSLAGSADDNGSLASVRGSARGNPRPPPPPPPPPPPAAADQPPAGDAPDAPRMMAAIPEEVEVAGAGGGREDDSDEGLREPLLGGRRNDAVHADDRAAAPAPVPVPVPGPVRAPPPAQQPNAYLRVRVPPSQSLLRPSRIHRRHRRRPPPPSGPASDSTRRRSRTKGASAPTHGEGEVVRVLIPSGGFSSERQLAECLGQAAGAGDVSTRDRWGDDYLADDDYSMDEYFDDRTEALKVAGMFRESDRVFIPLSVIYSDPTSFVGETLCMRRPPPPPKRPTHSPTPGASRRRSIFLTFIELMGIAIVAMASWWAYGAAQAVDWEEVWEEAAYWLELRVFAAINFPFWLFDVLVDFPLRELYRHGPSLIGWEGEPLPRICARITYHGDEMFWSRNLEECERIYEAKEAAAMQVRKPIVICLVILALFYMIKSIVAARALRRRERLDPNMVETYRAIQMLTRQLRRAVNAR